MMDLDRESCSCPTRYPGLDPRWAQLVLGATVAAAIWFLRVATTPDVATAAERESGAFTAPARSPLDDGTAPAPGARWVC